MLLLMRRIVVRFDGRGPKEDGRGRHGGGGTREALLGHLMLNQNEEVEGEKGEGRGWGNQSNSARCWTSFSLSDAHVGKEKLH